MEGFAGRSFDRARPGAWHPWGFNRHSPRFYPREQQRLVSVANLAALALENARLHDQIQREVQMLRRLIHAAQQVGQGQLSAEQITELESSAGWNEISQLSRVLPKWRARSLSAKKPCIRKCVSWKSSLTRSSAISRISEITDTEYFQRIQQKVKDLREKRKRR